MCMYSSLFLTKNAKDGAIKIIVIIIIFSSFPDCPKVSAYSGNRSWLAIYLFLPTGMTTMIHDTGLFNLVYHREFK